MSSLRNGNHDLNKRIMNEKAEYDGFGKQRKKKCMMVEKIIEDFQKNEYKFLVSLHHKYYECNLRNKDTFRCIRKKISQLFRDYDRAPSPKKKRLSLLTSVSSSSPSFSSSCTDKNNKRQRYTTSTSEESAEESTLATKDECGVHKRESNCKKMDNEASMQFVLSPKFEVFSEKFCVEDIDNISAISGLSISSDTNVANDNNEERVRVDMPPLNSDLNPCQTSVWSNPDSSLSGLVLSWGGSFELAFSCCNKKSIENKCDNEYFVAV